MDVSGKQNWGPGGSVAPDTTLYRSGAGKSTTDGTLDANALTVNGVPVSGGATDLRYDGNDAPGSYTDGDIVVQNGIAYMAVRPTTNAPVPWPAVQAKLTTNPQTGTSYTLALIDQDNIVELLNAAAIGSTIPQLCGSVRYWALDL